MSRQSEWTVKLMVKSVRKKTPGCTSAIGDDHLACGQRGQDRKGDDQDIAGIQQEEGPGKEVRGVQSWVSLGVRISISTFPRRATR